MKHEHLRKEMMQVIRDLHAQGFVPATSGNVSARTPEGTILITPSGLDYNVLEPEDMVLVDVAGKVLEGEFEPSSELQMHLGLYRSWDKIGGIVHTHAHYSTVLACLGWEIPPIHYTLASVADDARVRIAPYATYGTEELAHNARQALDDTHHACLLQNHGMIAVGETVSKAYTRTVILEEIASVYYHARLAGTPLLLDKEQIRAVSTKLSSYGQQKPEQTGAS